MKFIFPSLVVLVLTGCGDSCADRGGRLVQTGTILIPQKIGAVTIMQQYPKYKCVLDK